MMLLLPSFFIDVVEKQMISLKNNVAGSLIKC